MIFKFNVYIYMYIYIYYKLCTSIYIYIYILVAQTGATIYREPPSEGGRLQSTPPAQPSRWSGLAAEARLGWGQQAHWEPRRGSAQQRPGSASKRLGPAQQRPGSGQQAHWRGQQAAG